jgi:hypothetical protein
MKFKIIFLLSALLAGGLSASPNRSCNGVRCAITETAGVPQVLPASQGKCGTPWEMMIDEAELMPLHYFLRNF